MRTALISGGTRNIGLGIARRLGADGFRVAITSRSSDALDAAVAALVADGVDAFGVHGDVTDETSANSMAEQVADRTGSIDVLVNNAAARHHGAFQETSLDDWQKVLATTLTGAFLMTRAVLPGMTSRSWGRVVNIAGVSGQRGAQQRPALVSAKAGLIGLTKATALEFAASGITANAISPGLIDTARSEPLGDAAVAAEHYRQQLLEVPVGRLGRPDEVAGLCSYLCSDDAAFVTGQVMGINGGLYT